MTVDGKTVIPFRSMTSSSTVILQVAVCPPCSVVTVIVVVPAIREVTRPLLSTTATSGLLLVHSTFVLDASAGSRVAVS